MSINKNNKNFQITLDRDNAELLESLAARFGTSKSIIIKNALKVYAAKKSHKIFLKYSTLQEVEQTEQNTSRIKVKEPMTKEESDNWDKTIKELNDSLPPED